MKLLNKLIDKLTDPKWILLVIVLIPYGLYTKLEILQLANSNKAVSNMWDIIIIYWSDPFFIIYFVIPLWICLSIFHIDKEWNTYVLIRIGSLKKWLHFLLYNSFTNLLVFQIIQLIFSILISIQFPLIFNWSEYSSIDSVLTNLLSNSIYSPFLIVILQIFLLSLTMIVIQLLVVRWFLLSLNIGNTYIFGFFLWICIIFSFNLTPPDLNLVNVVNYISLPFTYNNFSTILIPFVVLLLIFATSLLIKGKIKYE